MSMIGFGGQTLATDLFWQAGGASPAEARRRALALVAAQDLGASAPLVVLRPTTPAQFGLSGAKDGHKPGLVSAAAALADALGGSWAGLFKVEEGWYLVEVRKDIIQPDGDRLLPPADGAKAREDLLRIAAAGRADRLFAPLDLAIPGSEEMTLSALLAGRRTSGPFATNRLRRLRAARSAPRLLLAALVGTALAAGLSLAWISMSSPAKPPPQAMTKAPPAWESAPDAAALVAICTKALLDHPILAGFAFRRGACGPTNTRFRYDQIARSAFDWPIAVPAACDQPQPTEQGWTVTCRHDPVRAQGRQKLISAERAKDGLWRRLVGAGFTVARWTPDIAPPGAPVQRQVSLEIRGTLPPDDVFDAQNALPALSIETVSLQPPRNWQIEGRIYVR